jgi:hypothetical protein
LYPVDPSCDSSSAFSVRSGLLPSVDTEAAVLRRASVCDREGRGGDFVSFVLVVARLSQPKGVVTLRPKEDAGGG